MRIFLIFNKKRAKKAKKSPKSKSGVCGEFEQTDKVESIDPFGLQPGTNYGLVHKIIAYSHPIRMPIIEFILSQNTQSETKQENNIIKMILLNHLCEKGLIEQHLSFIGNF